MRHFTKNHKCEPDGGATRKSQGITKVIRIHPLGTWMSVQTFMAIHPVVVEIFQSEPKWWTDWPTHQHYSPWSHGASMAKMSVLNANECFYCTYWEVLNPPLYNCHGRIICSYLSDIIHTVSIHNLIKCIWNTDSGLIKKCHPHRHFQHDEALLIAAQRKHRGRCAHRFDDRYENVKCWSHLILIIKWINSVNTQPYVE